MFKTFIDLIKHSIEWRSQIFHLASIDMQTTARGTALGWVWLFVKPGMYIFCFWFALYVGLKGVGNSGLDDVHYIVWLASGLIPWFFLSAALTNGSHAFRRFKYLVNKLKFPKELIPVFYTLSLMFVHLMLLACLVLGYFLSGGPITPYLVQIPIILILMFVFGVGFSLLTAPITAMSKDIGNLIKSLTTPLFWLSGVLFDVSNINNVFAHWFFNLNPVTFFAKCYRSMFVERDLGWIWNDPVVFGCGIGVVLLTFVAGLFVYSRLRKEIADVI